MVHQEVCRNLKSSSVYNMKNVSPRSGRIVWPASADAEKRTAPPPMIPIPLTEMKMFKAYPSKYNKYLPPGQSVLQVENGSHLTGHCDVPAV